jgi:Flp pilus assembly protein TadD
LIPGNPSKGFPRPIRTAFRSCAPILGSAALAVLIACSGANLKAPPENAALAELVDYRTGLSLLRAGRVDEAIQVFHRAKESNPRDPNVPNALGLALIYKKDYPGAEKAFTDALKLDPEFVQSHNNRGVARMEAGRLEDAEADFDAVLAGGNSAEKVNAHFNKGLLAARRDRWEDAEREFSLVLVTDPHYTKASRERGIARLRREDFRGALDDLLKYLKDDPNDAVANYDAALCILTTGRRDVAARYMERVVSTAPDSDEAKRARRFLDGEEALTGKP